MRINRSPDIRTLQQFAVISLLGFGLLGAVMMWHWALHSSPANTFLSWTSRPMNCGLYARRKVKNGGSVKNSPLERSIGSGTPRYFMPWFSAPAEELQTRSYQVLFMWPPLMKSSRRKISRYFFWNAAARSSTRVGDVE